MRVRLIRKMRGGAQAHLIEASDGHFYVVKFLNNPQHRRILVNEWIASAFLSYLGISTPEAAMVRVSEDFLRTNPEVYIQLGLAPPAGGDRAGISARDIPGDPARNVVYDFLPDSLLDKVENLARFSAACWPSINGWATRTPAKPYFSARGSKEWLPGSSAHPLRLGFVAQMVDNGYVFEGPHWRLKDSPLQGLYFRMQVYRDVRGPARFRAMARPHRAFSGRGGRSGAEADPAGMAGGR